MKFNRYIKIVIILAIIFSFENCQEDDYTFGDIIAPSNIQITAEIIGADDTNPNGDGSGEVKFTVTADNTVSFKLVHDGAEFVTLSGEQNIIFSKLGLSLIHI